MQIMLELFYANYAWIILCTLCLNYFMQIMFELFYANYTW
jgi:hypothetical protein